MHPFEAGSRAYQGGRCGVAGTTVCDIDPELRLGATCVSRTLARTKVNDETARSATLLTYTRLHKSIKDVLIYVRRSPRLGPL